MGLQKHYLLEICMNLGVIWIFVEVQIKGGC
jgi:hypothetical protein